MESLGKDPTSMCRQVTSLLRSLEKSVKNSTEIDADELSPILKLLVTLRDSFMKQGLLQRDSTKVEALCHRTSNSDVKQAINRGENKRKRRQGESSIQYQIQITADMDLSSTESDPSLLNASSSSSCDEILIMNAISRILNHTLMKDGDETFFPLVLIRAVVDVVTSICIGAGESHNPTHSSSENMYFVVECQIIESFSSTLLNGLVKTINFVRGNCINQETERIATLTSCCKCLTLLIVTLGTKLSRASTIMTQIRALAADILWTENLYKALYSTSSDSFRLMESICSLISVLPLTGDNNNTPCHKIWTRLLRAISSSYRTLLVNFFPDPSRKNPRVESTTGTLNEPAPVPLEEEILKWIESIPSNVSSQKQRLASFHHRSSVYSCLLLKTLSLDHYDTRAMTQLSTASIPISQLLDLCDLLLGFSSNAQRRLLHTKPRLRDVPVENGLFSVNSAVAAADDIKTLGLSLFQCIVSILNRSCLLYGKRLLLSCLSILKSCTSLYVLKIVDPTYGGSNVNLNKPEKKFSHCSICLRTKAINTVMIVLEQMGSTIALDKSSITLVTNMITGSLLEQILERERGNDEDDWGTLSERVELVAYCLQAINCICSVCGGFLPVTTRETIDSVAITCITHLRNDPNSSPLLSFASTKVAVLKLAMNCITSPWSDGCASSMLAILHSLALNLRYDREESVCSLAYMTLAVCNSLITPRAPPLVLGIRNRIREDDKHVDTVKSTVSYESMVHRIEKDSVTEKLKILKDKNGDDAIGCSTETPDVLMNVDESIADNDTIDGAYNPSVDATQTFDEKFHETDSNRFENGAGSIIGVRDSLGLTSLVEAHSVAPDASHQLSMVYHHDEIIKADMSEDRQEKLWTSAKGCLKSDSFDDDELPEIVDGDPDEEDQV